jgi:RNA-binding protein YhbY
MIIYLKDYSELEDLVDKYKPTVLVFGGKHEPVEPSARVLETIVDGKPLHEHFNPNDMLFVVHPKSATPADFWKKTYKKLLKLADDMIADKHVDYDFNGNNTPTTGKRLKRYLTIMDVLDERKKETMNEIINDEDSTEAIKMMLTKKDSETTEKIVSRIRSGKISELYGFSGFFFVLCKVQPGVFREYIKDKIGIPPTETQVKKRLEKIAPDTEIIFVHYTPIKDPGFVLIKELRASSSFTENMNRESPKD